MTHVQALLLLELVCSPFEHCHECGARVVRFRRGRPVCDNGWCKARFPQGEGLCPSPQQIRARSKILRELADMDLFLEPPSSRYSEHLLRAAHKKPPLRKRAR